MFADGTSTQYRGLGANIAGLNNTDALQKAGMDWKTIKLPLEIVGKRERRPSQFRSLVRSDNGVELGCCTDDYSPVHNYQLIEAMRAAAGSVNVVLDRAGTLDEGRRVWAIGTVPDSGFSLPVSPEWERRMQTPHGGDTSWVKGDATVLKILVGSGHVPGMALTIEFLAERLICTNGAKISEQVGKFRMVHSTRWDDDKRQQVAAILDRSKSQFAVYEAKARVMREVKMDRRESELAVIQLLQPKLLDDMVSQGRLTARVQDPGEYGGGHELINGYNAAGLLEEIVGRDERLITPDMFARSTNRVIELIPNQPGAAMAPNTVWNAFNAVTYYVDHERGRNADSGLNAALFGEGAQVKRQALDLMMEYADTLKAA